MLDQILELLQIAGALLVFISVWLITIAVVFRDVNRRNLNGVEQFLWLAAVTLLPLLGFLIYWVVRILQKVLMGEPSPGEDPRLRMTEVRAAPPPPENPQYGPPHAVVRGSSPGGLQDSRQRFSTVPGQPPDQSTVAYQAAPSFPGYMLVATEGPYIGMRFPLAQLPALVGRGSASMIQLNADQGVSRRHAEIYQGAGGALFIRDLNSTHGTFVNGARVVETSIKIGDRLSLGQTTFLLSDYRG
jgi:hypothetical protein